jgi:hypothetical protein
MVSIPERKMDWAQKEFPQQSLEFQDFLSDSKRVQIGLVAHW